MQKKSKIVSLRLDRALEMMMRHAGLIDHNGKSRANLNAYLTQVLKSHFRETGDYEVASVTEALYREQEDIACVERALDQRRQRVLELATRLKKLKSERSAKSATEEVKTYLDSRT